MSTFTQKTVDLPARFGAIQRTELSRSTGLTSRKSIGANDNNSPMLGIAILSYGLVQSGKKLGLRILLSLLTIWGATGVNAFAQTTKFIEAVPTAWRLQNYIGGPMVVYFTGSPCQNGQIWMPTSATSDEENRFYSMIMSAKISGKEVGVYYTYDGASCIVTSFYVKES